MVASLVATGWLRAIQGRCWEQLQHMGWAAAEAREGVAMERFAMVQGRQEAEMRHRLDRAAELTAEPEQTAMRQGIHDDGSGGGPN